VRFKAVIEREGLFDIGKLWRVECEGGDAAIVDVEGLLASLEVVLRMRGFQGERGVA